MGLTDCLSSGRVPASRACPEPVLQAVVQNSTTPLPLVARDPRQIARAGGRGGGIGFACLQSANHEVGTMQPVEEIAAECKAAGVPLFIAAAASVGRVALPADWSMLAASGHKWGGPPGVGVMVIRKSVRWRPPIPAGNREGRRVPGLPNLPAIMSCAAALDAVVDQPDEADIALRLTTSQIM